MSGGMSDRAKRPQLGRGLSALFGEGGGRVLSGPGAPRTVPIEAIRPSPFQPRRRFAEAEFRMKQTGLPAETLCREAMFALAQMARAGSRSAGA